MRFPLSFKQKREAIKPTGFILMNLVTFTIGHTEASFQDLHITFQLNKSISCYGGSSSSFLLLQRKYWSIHIPRVIYIYIVINYKK